MSSKKDDSESNDTQWSDELKKAKRTFNFKALATKLLKESEESHSKFESLTKIVSEICKPVSSDTGGIHQKDLLKTNIHVEILDVLKRKYGDKECPYAYRALGCLCWMNEDAGKKIRESGFIQILDKSIRQFSDSASLISEAGFALCGCCDGNQESVEKFNAERSDGEKRGMDIFLDAVKKHPKNAELAANICLSIGTMADDLNNAKLLLMDDKAKRWKTLISVFKNYRNHVDAITWCSYAIMNSMSQIPVAAERSKCIRHFVELVPDMWTVIHDLKSQDQTYFFLGMLEYLIELPELMERFVEAPSTFQTLYERCSRYGREGRFFRLVLSEPFKTQTTSHNHICFKYMNSFALQGGGLANMMRSARLRSMENNNMYFYTTVSYLFERMAYWSYRVTTLSKLRTILKDHFSSIFKILRDHEKQMSLNALADICRFVGNMCVLFKTSASLSLMKEPLLYAVEKLKLNPKHSRICCYAHCAFAECCSGNEWARTFLLKHDVHKLLTRSLNEFKNQQTTVGWIALAFNNLVMSSPVRKAFLDDTDIFKTLGECLRSGLFSDSEYNTQMTIHALGNMTYKDKEMATRVLKQIGPDPEKTIVSSIKSFIEDKCYKSMDSLGLCLNSTLHSLKNQESTRKFVEAGAFDLMLNAAITCHKNNNWAYVKNIFASLREIADNSYNNKKYFLDKLEGMQKKALQDMIVNVITHFEAKKESIFKGTLLMERFMVVLKFFLILKPDLLSDCDEGKVMEDMISIVRSYSTFVHVVSSSIFVIRVLEQRLSSKQKEKINSSVLFLKLMGELTTKWKALTPLYMRLLVSESIVNALKYYDASQIMTYGNLNSMIPNFTSFDGDIRYEQQDFRSERHAFQKHLLEVVTKCFDVKKAHLLKISTLINHIGSYHRNSWSDPSIPTRFLSIAINKLESKRDFFISNGTALLLLELSERCNDEKLRSSCLESVSNFHYTDFKDCLKYLESSKDFADQKVQSNVSCWLHVLVSNKNALKNFDMCQKVLSRYAAMMLKQKKIDNGDNEQLRSSVVIGLVRLLRKLAEQDASGIDLNMVEDILKCVYGLKERRYGYRIIMNLALFSLSMVEDNSSREKFINMDSTLYKNNDQLNAISVILDAIRGCNKHDYEKDEDLKIEFFERSMCALQDMFRAHSDTQQYAKSIGAKSILNSVAARYDSDNGDLKIACALALNSLGK